MGCRLPFSRQLFEDAISLGLSTSGAWIFAIAASLAMSAEIASKKGPLGTSQSS